MATSGIPLQRSPASAALIALSLATAISFFGALSWMIHKHRLITEVCQFTFAATVVAWLAMVATSLWRASYAVRNVASPPAKVYSFPRRFGLGTLLVITLAFGALSAFFRWLQWPGEVVLGALGFVGLIGAMQFAFDRAPRQASMLVGSLLLAAWPVILRLAYPQQLTHF